MSAKLDDVAAIVLNFRTADKTSLCIQSLIDEGLRNIVLVDNSEDGDCSLTALQATLDSHRTRGIRIDMVTDGSNQGFAKGVNAGFRVAKAQGLTNVLLMNSDAFFEKGGLKKMLSLADQYTFVQPMVKNGRNVESLFGYYHKALGLNYSAPRGNCFRYSSGCSVLIDIKKFSEGVLDEDFFFYGEDVDLAFRARKLGLEAVECHEAYIFHEGSGSAKRGSLFYEYHINRCHWLTAKKFASNATQRYVFYFIRIFTLSARALVRSFRYRSLLPVKGFLMASFDFVIGRTQSLTPPA